jgi:hypothetical protein
MLRQRTWFFSAVVMLAVSAPLPALTYEVGGCKTVKSYVNFTTISLAVIGVPAGSTIEVCPGVYPEQVTITQPLTLKGIAFNNASRAVITMNPNGSLGPNVNGLLSEFYAQVLVQNVNPPGPVDLIGITVDGAGINFDCQGSEFLAGIFYASGTTGTVNAVTTRNQVSSGCGWGIWVENGDATNQSITIENSSAHPGGIVALTCQNPPTLAVTIKGNFVNGGVQTYEFDVFGAISVAGANGSITGNLVTGGQYGITTGNDDVCQGSGIVTASQNTVADLQIGTFLFNGSGVITSNKLSNVQYPFFIFANTTYTQSPTTIEDNTAMNSNQAVEFFYCATTDWTVKGNIFNDSQVAFYAAPSAITGNTLYNTDTIQTGSCM